MAHNLFERARINYDALMTENPSIAGVVARMLLNEYPFKHVRNYVRKHVEESARKKVIVKKKTVLVPKKPAVKVVKNGKPVKPTNPKDIKRTKPSLTTTEQAKRDAKKASQFVFKMPPLQKVEAKFMNIVKVSGPKKDTNHDRIYGTIEHALHQVGHFFNSAEFANVGSPIEADFNNYATWIDRTCEVDDHSNYINLRSDHVETDLRDRLNLKLSLRIPNSDDAAQAGPFRSCIRILRAFFPGFQTPEEYTRVKLEDIDESTARELGIRYSGGSGSLIVFKNQKVMKRRISLDDLMDIKPVYSHYDAKWTGPINVEFPNDVGKELGASGRSTLRNMIDFEFTLSPDPDSTSSTNSYVIGSGTSSGSAKEARTRLTAAYTLSCNVFIKWPKEFAFYATSALTDDEFLPAFFLRYVLLHKQYAARESQKTGGFKPPNRIAPLGRIKRDITEEAKIRKIVPRVNADGFTIVGATETKLTGTVLWVPSEKDRVDDYMTMYRNAYQSEGNQVVFDPKDMIVNTPILADWANGMFTYANATKDFMKRGVTTIDLTGSVPLDEVTIGRDLNSRLSDTTRLNFPMFHAQMVGFLSKFGYDDVDESEKSERRQLTQSGVVGVTKADGQYIPELADMWSKITPEQQDLLDRSNVRTLESALNRLISSPTFADITWADLGYKEQVVDSDNTHSELTLACLAFYRVICERALSKLAQWDVAFKEKAEFIRYYLFLICRYSKKTKTYVGKFKEALRINSNVAVNKEKMPVIFNLPGVETLMPHQGETENCLGQDDQMNAMIGVDAGGGKTIQTLMDFTRLLMKKRIRYAVVVPPNNLVSTWVDEIINLGRGKLNVVPLTITTLREMEAVYSDPDKPKTTPDYLNLGRFLLSCPINTIFVPSMSFLKSHSETIVYGDTSVVRYYMAEFLRDLFNRDPNGYVCGIDESHYVKTIGSDRTSAVSVLFTGAKIKRQLSGTMVFDRLTDLVGQSALNNPAALGNMDDFNKRYKDGDVYRPNAQKEILADMQPFTQNIRIRRRRWAFLLPPLIERFHPAPLTENQAVYYNQIVKDAIDEILADAKLRKKMEEMEEKDEAAVLHGLSSHLHKVESFIYAPDAHLLVEKYGAQKTGVTPEKAKKTFAFQIAFSGKSSTRPVDLVSPKVAIIDNIIEEHVNGITAKGESVEKIPTKILVFAQRKVNSLHAYEHSRHKNIAVHYSAGDFEALTRFLNDPKIKVIFANETSINTGKNFQLASRLIRVETLWTPGAQEQAIARTWRPDFKDVEMSNRHNIFMDWVYSIPSFEVIKIARLISKMVSKKKYDEADYPPFMTQALGSIDPVMKARIEKAGVRVYEDEPVFELIKELKELKLSPHNLRTINMPHQVDKYLGTYALMNTWEDKEFDRAKKDPKNKLWVVPKDKHAEIPGSKAMQFMPRVPGQRPFDPIIGTNSDGSHKYKYDYVPVAVVEAKARVDEFGEENVDAADSDDVETIDANGVELQEIVNSQWGYGRVVKINKKDTLRIAVPGIKESILVSKATVYKIGNRKSYLELETMFKKRQIQMLFPTGVETKFALGKSKYDLSGKNDVSVPKLNPSRKLNVDDDDGDVDTVVRFGHDKVGVKDKDQTVNMELILVDKQVSLAAYEEDNDTDILESRYNFRRLDPFYAVQIDNYKAFDKFLDRIKSRYTIREEFIDSLLHYRDAMRRNRLSDFDPDDYDDVKRFITKVNHVKVAKNVLRPYGVAWNGTMFVCFNRETQPATATLKQRLSGLPGVHVWREQARVIRLFRSASEAISTLEMIMKKVNVENGDELMADLRKAKRSNY